MLQTIAPSQVPSGLAYQCVHTDPIQDDSESTQRTAPQIIHSPQLIDHNQLRKCTVLKRSFVRLDFDPSAAPQLFHPSPASQMTQTMAFGYSLFFKGNTIRSNILSKSIKALASELPPLAGRVRPPTQPPGLRCMNETAVVMNNAGIEYVTAEAKGISINDLGPHTWVSGMNNCRLSDFGVPFYAEPFAIDEMYKGNEALFKVKLTRCLDGQIVSVTINHILADAGRSVKLLERLSHLYRRALQEDSKASDDSDIPLHFNPKLETPDGYARAMHDPPTVWQPSPVDHTLTTSQWLAAPYRLYSHSIKHYDVFMVYLPGETLKRLKNVASKKPAVTETSASDNGDDHENNVQFSSTSKISTMDAVQAFIATLIADVRGRNLVPRAPEEFTVNVDLLHPGLNWKDAGSFKSHVGNAVHILHVQGYKNEEGESSGNMELPLALHDGESGQKKYWKLSTALQLNARLIRNAISTFRSDPAHALRALQRQERMVSLPEAQVAAAFVVKGADMKLASTTAVSAFPFDKVCAYVSGSEY